MKRATRQAATLVNVMRLDAKQGRSELAHPSLTKMKLVDEKLSGCTTSSSSVVTCTTSNALPFQISTEGLDLVDGVDLTRNIWCLTGIVKSTWRYRK